VSILFRERGETRAITSLPWGTSAWGEGGLSTSGERVTPRRVSGLDAVAAVVGLFSDVVYMLPVDVFRSTSDDFRPITSPQIVATPSLAVDARTWRVQALVSWLLHGNAFGLVIERSSGYPSRVEWLDPSTVTVDEPGGILRPAVYSVLGQTVPRDEILHIPGRYVPPGTRLGVPPLARSKETFGLALAAQRFASRWFGDGAHPSAILSTEQPVTQEQAATIKTRFVEALRGKREPAVLGAGLKYQQVQTDPKDSQMIESRQESALAVCRAMGLNQPEMIGVAQSGSAVTYANREQRAIDFLTYSADQWLVRFEDLYTACLPRPQYAKINRGALLRSDTMTRYNAHNLGVRGGWRSVNDIRAIEDEPPIPDGDQYLWPPYAVTPSPTDGGSNG
jgi:HK97 family phage portal protein